MCMYLADIRAIHIQQLVNIMLNVFTNFKNMIKYKQIERRWNYVWKEFKVLQVEKQYVDERACRFSPDISYGNKPL